MPPAPYRCSVLEKKGNWIMKKILSVFFAIAMSTFCMAQSFNTDSYKSIGVYDTWEQSPFRTGELSGNVKVIKNHIYSNTGKNRTGHIVGIQRSRFGSNTFGLKVELNEPITIGQNGKYVHALVYTPKASKVQIIGLGKRTTNTWNETEDVEQFWSDGISINANSWTDVVANVKTNANVRIYSIVIVPDCSSPHNLTEDFIAYIDEILVNSSSASRSYVTSSSDPYDNSEPDEPTPEEPEEDEIYGMNFDKTRENTYASSRYIRSVSLTSDNGQKQQYPSSNSYSALTTKLYLDATSSAIFEVNAGESYTPDIDYSTDWMHAYAYIDYNRDGEFSHKMNANGHAVDNESELVCFSAYSTDYTGGATGNWYDSNGKSLGNMAQGNYSCNTTTMPSFTVPANLQSGLYRMRLKIDWCSLDAGGNDGSDGTNNAIWSNGGGIIDIMLNVKGNDNASICASSYRNGNMSDNSGATITTQPLTVARNTEFEVRMHPANGFVTESLTVVYKKNSNEYSGYLENDTVTYTTADACYSFSSDAFTLPESMMYSEVAIEPLFNNRPATMLLGDANGDGHVDISDVTTAIDRILKNTWTTADGIFILRNADVNADDRIDISDVTGIIDIVLGRNN